MLTLLALSLLLTFGCSKNDPAASVADPDGTMTTNISDGTSVDIGSGTLGWTEPNNFTIAGGYTNNSIGTTSETQVSICDAGKMKGLGNVTIIPKTGFSPSTDNYYLTNAIACEAGHGYVFRIVNLTFYGATVADSTYARLYVVSSLTSTDGGVMGATVKYQYPFNP